MTAITRRTLLAASAAAAATTVARPSRAHAAGSTRIAVIGSGYGGAVAAKRLAQAGHRLDLFEMGADWSTIAPRSDGRVFDPMTGPTGRSTWFADRTDLPFATFFGLDVVNKAVPRQAGVLDSVRFSGTKVYRGVGVGGGSLVNGGMAVTPRRSFLGQVMPALDLDELYRVHLPRAAAELGVAPPPADVLALPCYRYTRTSATAVARAGYRQVDVPNVYDWDYLRRESRSEVPRSALQQEVVFGNNAGKRSLPRTVLREALATGRVDLQPMTEVTSLGRNPDGTFAVRVLTRSFTGQVVGEGTQTYDRVVLAAGSVGTCELLLRARAAGTLRGLPESTGQGWGPNGNVMLSRLPWLLAGKETGTVQSTMPAQGVMAWDDGPGSVFAEVAPLPVGFETYTSLYLALTNNPNLGRYTWDAARGRLDLTWDRAMHAPSVAAARAVFDRVNEAAGSYYRTDLFEDGVELTDYFTYHPLGGMVLGEATDLNGEVRGEPGLFVMDGSLVPGRLGVNPFLTITALAERNMDRLLAARRFD